MELANGAGLFKDAILSRSYGRNDPVHRVFSGYKTWRHLIHEISTLVEQLKKQRWDDDLEDIEDDLVLESRNTALSQEDPQMLQDELDTKLESAYKELHERIEQLLKIYKDDDNIGQIGIYVLRIIRDLRADLPKGSPLRSFGLSLVPALHQQVASSVSTASVEAFVKSSARTKVPGRALWEGDPELPVQPTPNTFKFLRALSTAMGSAGSDLWSTHAVKTLKLHISAELSKNWMTSLDTATASKVNGKSVNDDVESENGVKEDVKEESTEEEDKLQKELLTQSLFDLLVFKEAFCTDGDILDGVEKDIEAKIDLDTSSRKRLQHGAREYWKRTSLLFGLLA
jgi:hypothetical protein